MARVPWRVAVAGCLALLALGGCRTRPVSAPVLGPGADAPWAEQQAALARVENYSLSGRLAVAAREQGFSGALRYQQQARRAELAIDGPMGMGGARVTLDGEDLAISTSRGEVLDGAAARAELEQRLGFMLPLSELRWWLLGIPAPGEVTLQQDAGSGEIRGFQQHGWQVNVESRSPAMGFALPRKLTATRDGARLRLLVESWQP